MLIFMASFLGCHPTCVVDVSYADSPHTVTLTWSDADWAGDLTYGFNEDLHRTVETSTEGGLNTATLTGLPALSEVYYLLNVEGEECAGTFSTNNLAPTTPDLSVSLYAPDEAASWGSIAGVIMGENPSLFILDRFGNWLWSHAHDPDLTSSAVAVDGNEILFNTFDQDRTNDVGAVHRLSLAGENIEDITTEGAHHVFSLLPDGAMAWPSIDVREWYDSKEGKKVSVVGDRILERSAEGEIREVFNIWDHEEPTRHNTWDSTFYPQGRDWTHVNAVNYSEIRGTYSCRSPTWISSTRSTAPPESRWPASPRSGWWREARSMRSSTTPTGPTKAPS